MKVQRLIEKYGEKFKLISKDYPYDRALSELWYDIKQLDEPQKVKVSEEEEKFLKTFDFNCENDVTKALYNVSRVGWGYHLTDNNGNRIPSRSLRLLVLCGCEMHEYLSYHDCYP